MAVLMGLVDRLRRLDPRLTQGMLGLALLTLVILGIGLIGQGIKG